MTTAPDVGAADMSTMMAATMRTMTATVAVTATMATAVATAMSTAALGDRISATRQQRCQHNKDG